jgi:hypothetical protein
MRLTDTFAASSSVLDTKKKELATKTLRRLRRIVDGFDFRRSRQKTDFRGVCVSVREFGFLAKAMSAISAEVPQEKSEINQAFLVSQKCELCAQNGVMLVD